MKRWAPLLLLALGGCSLLGGIIKLPFQLLGAVLNLVFGLFKALLGLGSAAALGAAKYAPFALLFSQNGEPESPPTRLERLVGALETASLEMTTVEEGLKNPPAGTHRITLIDPFDLVLPERREKILQDLGNDRILSTRWVSAPSRTP